MESKSFLDLFPVPKYLRLPAVGFDVSDNSVKFIELIGNERVSSVGSYGRREYKDDLTQVLSSIQKQYGFCLVNVSIPEAESFFFRIRLPKIPENEIRGAIELQLEEYIPYQANDVEFDYEVLKTDPHPGGYIDVNVAVLPKKVVGEYLDNFRKAGFIPSSLSIEAEATARAAIPARVDTPIMIVNIGRLHTSLSIVKDQAVMVSYTFKFGGENMIRGLQETCSVSTGEAERLKNEKGLTDTVENRDVFGCLLPMISIVRDEIRSHRRFWLQHRQDFMISGDEDISRVIICGSQAGIPGLISYLSMALSLPAELANPWVNALNFESYIPPISYKDSLEYTTAIGLALAGFK